jgi:hypothetical protein
MHGQAAQCVPEGVSVHVAGTNHGLRFDVKRLLESTDQFRKRINLAPRDEEKGTVSSSGGGPFLAHRAPGSAPRVFAHRHLARSGSGPGKSRHYRCLSDGGLAEGTARYGPVRRNCSVRVDSQHQGAGGRSRSLHGGRQSHRHSGPSRSLIAFGDKRMDFNTTNIHVPPACWAMG